MKPKLEPADPFWWFWAITLAFIAAAIVGWTPGYYITLLLKHMPWNRNRTARLA